MEIPLEIAFHNTPSSELLEAEIRKRVAKLEKIYPRLVGCRVSIEALHKQHRTGNAFEVHLWMKLPGTELSVTREPHRAKQRRATPNVHTILRDTFKAAESRLKDFKEVQHREVKPHPAMLRGRIERLERARDCGFILTDEGKHLYFHRNSLLDGDFERLGEGDEVHFVEAMGDTGPTASKVWTAPEAAEGQA